MSYINSIKNFLEENSSRKNFILAGVLLFILSFVIFFTDHGLIKKISLELDKNTLAEEILTEKNKMDSLNLSIDKLLNDSLEIEKIAREKYGLIKPGEEVYFIIKKED